MKIKNNRHLLKKCQELPTDISLPSRTVDYPAVRRLSQDALCIFPIQTLVRDGNTVLHLVTDRLIPQVQMAFDHGPNDRLVAINNLSHDVTQDDLLLLWSLVGVSMAAIYHDGWFTPSLRNWSSVSSIDKASKLGPCLPPRRTMWQYGLPLVFTTEARPTWLMPRK